MKNIYKFFIGIAILIGGLLLIYQIYNLFNPSVRTQLVTKGIIEEVVSADAMIIRDETVILKESDVIVSSVMTDGSRVSKGEKLADLYYGSVTPEVQAKLREVNGKIKDLTELSRRSGTDSSNSLDTMLKNYASEIVSASHKNDGDALHKIRNGIGDIINRKIVSDSENATATISALKAEQTELEGQVSGEKKEMLSSDAGLYFSIFDGYEEKISLDLIETLTPSGMTELKKTAPDKNRYDATMKVTDGYNWYIAIMLDEGKLPSLKRKQEKGETIDIRFSQYGEETYPVSIMRISDAEKGKVVVIGKGTAYSDAIYYNRFLDADVVLNSYEGLKFFKDAVRISGDKTGVYIIKNDSIAKFKEIEVLATDKGYCVAKEDNLNAGGLLLYDEVIITRNSIKDGDIVR